MSSKVDGVREVSRGQADFLAARGLVHDLSRDEVVVHVGKPVGSISGWVGPIFWQVWVDAVDLPGAVHANSDLSDRQTWQFDPALSKEQLLDRAKDRLIAEVQATRAARLDKAEADLAALPAA